MGRPRTRYAPSDSPIMAVLRWGTVFSVVTAAWLLFKLPDFGQALLYFRAMATNWSAPLELRPIFTIAFFSLPVFLIHARALLPEGHRTSEPWLNTTAPATWRAATAYGVMAFLLLFDAGPPGEFIYFQF